MDVTNRHTEHSGEKEFASLPTMQEGSPLRQKLSRELLLLSFFLTDGLKTRVPEKFHFKVYLAARFLAMFVFVLRVSFMPELNSEQQLKLTFASNRTGVVYSLVVD